MNKLIEQLKNDEKLADRVSIGGIILIILIALI
jgi:hypothetical protein